MTGKSQSEAVSILRSTKLGSEVHLVISRQVQLDAAMAENDKSPTSVSCSVSFPECW